MVSLWNSWQKKGQPVSSEEGAKMFFKAMVQVGFLISKSNKSDLWNEKSENHCTDQNISEGRPRSPWSGDSILRYKPHSLRLTSASVSALTCTLTGSLCQSYTQGNWWILWVVR